MKASPAHLPPCERAELARRRKLDPQERAQIAKDDYSKWFRSASDFFWGYQQYFGKRKYKNAALELHQATERFYSAVELVFSGYKPKTHDLRTLSHLAAGHDPAFLPIFPQATPKEKNRFELLRRAYVDARYDKTYKITRAELEYLAERVQKLKTITQKMCKRRIKKFIEA